MTTTTEFRSLVEAPEFHGAENGRTIRASGVAMRYDSRSKPILDPRRSNVVFRERIMAGTFARSIAQGEVRSHNEHGGPYLARTANGTLRLTDDRSTLAYELDLPDTSAGRDAAALLERGDIRGCSVGFGSVLKLDEWSVDEDGMALRSVHEARLGLVDLTVAPAYDSATAELALRSLADQRGVEVRSLMEAADRDGLPTLIASTPEDHRSDDARETPTVVRPAMAASMY